MPKQMLIDASHEEEIRVVVASGTQIDEYDIQTAFRKQIRSNIYLAKIVRVEPSLQAAFVDYGGDRHGFLSFNDIHPDYYQIPIEDRRKLLEEQETLKRSDRAAQERLEEIDGGIADDDLDLDDENGDESAEAKAGPDEDEDEADDEGDGEDVAEAGEAESAAPAPAASKKSFRRYKIQEVIKPQQIILVQVLKEARGTKGAALTTFISLPGRYCVLMPNALRTGGISRRITNPKERNKLRDTLAALEIPQGMGLIIRTAGIKRTKAEIRRDLEFLLRTWDEVREVTLSSIAPCLVYEEGDIVKRSIRDVFTKEIDKVLIEGPETYRTAKQFMQLMMPSQARRVQRYTETDVSIFQRHKIEQQLEALYKPTVRLKSGGSLVINQTEALVAIDVNSGRSTGQRNAEETALKTNLEAADEIARQLRLRDLAGLIVIDFIDMDENRNVRKVERRAREALKNDRARLKTGRISEFGLMELSRQRMRPSLIESSSDICPHCQGTGHVLSPETLALRLIRAIEEEAARKPSEEIKVFVSTELAIHVLNHKRGMLGALESQHGLKVVLQIDDSAAAPEFRFESVPSPRKGAGKRADGQQSGAEASSGKSGRKRGRRRKNDGDVEKDGDGGKQVEAAEESVAAAPDGEKPKRPRRRRRRRKSANGEAAPAATPADAPMPEVTLDPEPLDPVPVDHAPVAAEPAAPAVAQESAAQTMPPPSDRESGEEPAGKSGRRGWWRRSAE